MNKLKTHEQFHKDDIPFWEYYCMDRGIKDKPLMIWFNCGICRSTITVNYDIDINTINLINKSELKHDMKLVEEQGIENIFRIHPRGKIITIADKRHTR